jgi:glutamate formiminotransferase
MIYDKAEVEQIIEEMFKSGKIKVLAHKSNSSDSIKVLVQVGDTQMVTNCPATAPCGSSMICPDCMRFNNCSEKRVKY